MKSRKRKVGRPTVVTHNTVKQLRRAFMWGATDQEACAFAGISPATLYRYQARIPEFREQKQDLTK